MIHGYQGFVDDVIWVLQEPLKKGNLTKIESSDSHVYFKSRHCALYVCTEYNELRVYFSEPNSNNRMKYMSSYIYWTLNYKERVWPFNGRGFPTLKSAIRAYLSYEEGIIAASLSKVLLGDFSWSSRYVKFKERLKELYQLVKYLPEGHFLRAKLGEGNWVDEALDHFDKSQTWLFAEEADSEIQ